MKSFIISLIMVGMFCGEAFSAETIMWYINIDNERIAYSVDVESNVGTREMNHFNHALEIILRNGGYLNIDEMERIINRTATGDIRNFTVVDITTDEK